MVYKGIISFILKSIDFQKKLLRIIARCFQDFSNEFKKFLDIYRNLRDVYKYFSLFGFLHQTTKLKFPNSLFRITSELESPEYKNILSVENK